MSKRNIFWYKNQPNFNQIFFRKNLIKNPKNDSQTECRYFQTFSQTKRIRIHFMLRISSIRVGVVSWVAIWDVHPHWVSLATFHCSSPRHYRSKMCITFASTSSSSFRHSIPFSFSFCIFLSVPGLESSHYVLYIMFKGGCRRRRRNSIKM